MEKMNRYNEMQNFLTFFADVYDQNPNIEINKDSFYRYLEMYGLNKEEFEQQVPFNNLINAFKDVPNINCYHDERQKRFLQFNNRFKHKGETKTVKIYLSFDKENIEKCVYDIFNFMAKNNIEHISKIADITRADSVCLRIFEMEDAKKVIDYINNNEKIAKASKPTNPFNFKEGIVGIAYDDLISYNATLSSLLEMYFKTCREKETLKQVSLQSFDEVICSFYNETFKKQNFGNILNSSKFHFPNRFETDGQNIQNCEEVIKLIHFQLNPNMGLRDFTSFYNSALNIENTNKMIKYYNDVLDYKKNSEISKKESKEEVVYKTLLDSYIDYAIKKYGSDKAYNYLYSYTKGNSFSITRDQNYRKLFHTYLPPHRVIELCNGNIKEYMNKINTTVNVEDKYNIFISGCIATLNKYGSRQLYYAISKAANQNDFNSFTRGNENYRDKMKELLTKEDIISYCQTYVASRTSNTIPLDDSIYNLFVNTLDQEINKQQLNSTMGR